MLGFRDAEAQLLVKKKGSYKNNAAGSFSPRQNPQQNQDRRKFHYGFYVGLNSNSFMTVKSEAYTSSPAFSNLIGINPKSSLGFSLGFLVSYRLGDHWDLRFTPGVGFYERSLDYIYRDFATNTDTTINQNIESTMVELPFLVRFKSQMRGPKDRQWGMYMVAGVKPAINITCQKEQDPSLLRTNAFDCSIEYGIGIDKKYQYFRFSPELRFSFGVLNRLIQDDNGFSLGLKNLNTNTVSLIFHFQ